MQFCTLEGDAQKKKKKKEKEKPRRQEKKGNLIYPFVV